ncbi:MAG: bifunctional metallophosphatase/5'-nucleotidase [Agathobacter sp.]|nr:bifunctional metallophosphatase/5'-nucleotidase [Agathobacter sp.]
MRKKIAALGLGLLMLLAVAVPQLDAFADENKKTVDIMFMHDTHSHLNEFSTVENDVSVTMGGFARIKTLINQQMAENKDTLLLDAGDFSMGTLVQVVYAEEAAELRMLGHIGVDAMTFGNHEFDYKAEGIANMLNTAVASGDTLPNLLICNMDWEAMKASGLTEDQKLILDAFENYGVKDYVVIEKGDVNIAVIGVFGKDAEACVAQCPVVFKDPIEAVKKTVAEIEANENVDMIVCVSHSGVSSDEESSEDELLAKAVPELDLIISGHTHTKLDEPIQHGTTYIASCAEYGKYLGDISMTQNADGSWEMKSYDLIPVTTDIEPDKETQAAVDYFLSMVDEKYLSYFGLAKDQVLCTNEIEFATVKDLGRLHTELNLGSLIADAYTYAVENSDTGDDNPVMVAVAPAGTIRDTYALGNITVENVFNSFSLGIGEDGIPGYPLISVYLTGEELKLVAEIDSSISDLMTTARLYTDGLYWHYNPNRMILNKTTQAYIIDSAGNRIELEDDKLYRVVTDFYSSQMLGGVTDMSFGLLSLIPKYADGTPIERYEDAAIKVDGKELKAWNAIAQYMMSFEDTDADGIPNVPAVYATTEGRKVVEDSTDIKDLISNPNKFFFMIVGIAVVLIVLVVLIYKGFRKISRKYGLITKFRQLKTLKNKIVKLVKAIKK